MSTDSQSNLKCENFLRLGLGVLSNYDTIRPYKLLKLSTIHSGACCDDSEGKNLRHEHDMAKLHQFVLACLMRATGSRSAKNVRQSLGLVALFSLVVYLLFGNTTSLDGVTIQTKDYNDASTEAANDNLYQQHAQNNNNNNDL